MIDANLLRWLKASINKYFDDAKSSYNLFIEGQNIDPVENSAYCELHISVGPDISENTATDSTIDLSITIMCSTWPSSNILDNSTMAGYFANLMAQAIQIKKFGNLTGDDQSLIGCMIPQGKCRVQEWGYVTVESRATTIVVQQTHVEREYQLNF